MDNIAHLPHATEQHSQSDSDILQALFKAKASNNIIKLLIPGLVFILVNLPFVDTLMVKVGLEPESLTGVLVKALVFIVLLWIAQLWALK